ncbi:adenosylcobinamide-GDP ribazoletransferase [Pseudogemmobacter humi]|uniref:Adenosylcobinamide-GDP ribazoletransferase n=1 Tax=Pseudogemmobacter humi TaxID=2483812 RepID=A0A3P5XRR9_9RHOB|nr:adenosylcobinamide-GDP ribazoletransferase [Pseudogemmobacter humi]VDC33065.1 Cobalamin synthase [Pseudogemmobacter humi]
MPPIQRLTGDLLSAFSLLTRLPMPAHDHSGAASAWAWPVVGLAVGGVGALTVWLGGLAELPPGPLAALALAAMAMATGGLHEDGLADTADGLFGGRDRERRLAIMKDSHIGSFGTLALVLVTLAAWSALTGLIASGRAVPALMAAAALSRAPMAAIMAALPPARASGLSAASGRPPAPAALAAVLIGAALCLGLSGTGGLAAILATALLCAALARAAQNRIGGQTGDILGASQQLAFAASLALLG